MHAQLALVAVQELLQLKERIGLIGSRDARGVPTDNEAEYLPLLARDRRQKIGGLILEAPVKHPNPLQRLARKGNRLLGLVTARCDERPQDDFMRGILRTRRRAPITRGDKAVGELDIVGQQGEEGKDNTAARLLGKVRMACSDLLEPLPDWSLPCYRMRSRKLIELVKIERLPHTEGHDIYRGSDISQYFVHCSRVLEISEFSQSHQEPAGKMEVPRTT